MGARWLKNEINGGNAGHHVLIICTNGDIFTSYWWWSCFVSLKEWFIMNYPVYYGIKWKSTSMSPFLYELISLFLQMLKFSNKQKVMDRSLLKNKIKFYFTNIYVLSRFMSPCAINNIFLHNLIAIVINRSASLTPFLFFAIITCSRWACGLSGYWKPVTK